MPTQEEITHQQGLLTTHRRNLNHFLSQQALYGGAAFAPPVTANGIREARENIRHIKTTLRGWGVAVDDHPDDEEASAQATGSTTAAPPPSPTPSAGGGGNAAPAVESGGTQGELLVFLSYATEDRDAVQSLYQKLQNDGMRPWMDEEDLLPGQPWKETIAKVVRDSDVVLACLSPHAVSTAGQVQRQMKLALDVADEQPEGTIFLIPVLLEPCEVPDRLSHLTTVNLFDARGYDKLLRALRVRAGKS
jgi:nucleotide-binding universal stress UspA family protein